jgi:hypothetical protein
VDVVQALSAAAAAAAVVVVVVAPAASAITVLQELTRALSNFKMAKAGRPGQSDPPAQPAAIYQ